MKWIIVGLGNPGKEYKYTRHNAGRLAVEAFGQREQYTEFENDKKSKSLITEGSVEKNAVVLLLPETFMNKSGSAVTKFVKSVKDADKLIVVYDDIDLPFGSIRISFARGSGGHKGVESIIRSVKTKNFIRVRIGVAPITPSGKIKKPVGEQRVYEHLLGTFKKKEIHELPAIFEKVSEILHTITAKGRAIAMNQHN